MIFGKALVEKFEAGIFRFLKRGGQQRKRLLQIVFDFSFLFLTRLGTMAINRFIYLVCFHDANSDFIASL